VLKCILLPKIIEEQSITSQLRKLKLIPYEQFASIEYLTEGGFSKIYKAKWVNNKMVVLKTLNDSQGISKDFLQEISNYEVFSNCENIVKCYGVILYFICVKVSKFKFFEYLISAYYYKEQDN